MPHRPYAVLQPGRVEVSTVEEDQVRPFARGDTDPQWVLPYGGNVTVDGPARRIVVHYPENRG